MKSSIKAVYINGVRKFSLFGFNWKFDKNKRHVVLSSRLCKKNNIKVEFTK
jgi:hypothetical protein